MLCYYVLADSKEKNAYLLTKGHLLTVGIHRAFIIIRIIPYIVYAVIKFVLHIPKQSKLLIPYTIPSLQTLSRSLALWNVARVPPFLEQSSNASGHVSCRCPG